MAIECISSGWIKVGNKYTDKWGGSIKVISVTGDPTQFNTKTVVDITTPWGETISNRPFGLRQYANYINNGIQYNIKITNIFSGYIQASICYGGEDTAVEDTAEEPETPEDKKDKDKRILLVAAVIALIWMMR